MIISRLSILSSFLFSAAAALPATAAARPSIALDHFARCHGLHGARLEEPAVARAHKPAGQSAVRKRALPDTSFTIVDEPDADPTLYGTRVFGINESGQISGHYVDSDGAFHAFLATPQDGSFTFIPVTVRHNDTFSGFLNDKGEMFGSFVDRHTGIENAWLRHRSGKIETVEVEGGTQGTIIQGLNNKGVLTGNYFDDNGAFRGFIRAKDGMITKFEDPTGGTESGLGTNPIGINNLGDVSGIVFDSGNVAHGFIRHHADESIEDFDVPGAGTAERQGTLGLEIDDKGWVTGAYIDSSDVSHGFIRDPEGNVTTVDPPDAGMGAGQGTVAVEHREAGWSVGEYVDSNDVFHGYYRTNNETYVEFDPPGAADIGTYTVLSSNRDHQIVGTFKDDNAIRHGFIRNPQ